MKQFYVYSVDLRFLGEILAVDEDAAKILALAIWRESVKITSYRLTFNRTLAA